MALQAKITSVDALERFRASLIVFLNKAHSSLDQTTDEIRRMRGWIEHDRRTYWEAEVRRRARTVAQAEQELLSARMTQALDDLSAQQLAVRKARALLEEAQQKVRNVKLWRRDLDGVVDPVARGLNSLRTYLDHELPGGIAHLVEMQRILESYSETHPAAAPAPAREEMPAEPL